MGKPLKILFSHMGKATHGPMVIWGPNAILINSLHSLFDSCEASQLDHWQAEKLKSQRKMHGADDFDDEPQGFLAIWLALCFFFWVGT